MLHITRYTLHATLYTLHIIPFLPKDQNPAKALRNEEQID